MTSNAPFPSICAIGINVKFPVDFSSSKWLKFLSIAVTHFNCIEFPRSVAANEINLIGKTPPVVRYRPPVDRPPIPDVQLWGVPTMIVFESPLPDPVNHWVGIEHQPVTFSKTMEELVEVPSSNLPPLMNTSLAGLGDVFGE